MKPTANEIEKVTMAAVAFNVKSAEKEGRRATGWKDMNPLSRRIHLDAIRAAIEKWERIRARKNKRRARKC